MSLTRLLAAGVLCLLLCTAADGSALTFIDDYEGFVEAAPTEVQVIDFETLPDGSPSYPSAVITPEFNYTHLGATFLPHHDPGLYIHGNSMSGFRLTAESYPSSERNWINADFVAPASAVGTYFVSISTLSAYGTGGDLIATITHWYSGLHFIGIVSDTPIAYATVDVGTSFAFSEEFVFANVPEPSSGLGLLIITAFALARRRRCAARQSAKCGVRNCLS